MRSKAMDARFLSKCQSMLATNDNLFGESITINGVPATANVSTLKYEVELEIGGFQEKIGLNVVQNKAQNIVPVIGQIVNYNGAVYRVFQVESDIVSFTFVCDTVNK